MTVVLIVLVVACCIGFMWQADQGRRQLVQQSEKMHDQVDRLLLIIDASLVRQSDNARLALENDARATELQAALSQAELQARTQERVAAMQQAVVPPEGTGPVDAWFSGAPNVMLDDPDPMNVDPLPEQQFPTFGEQQDGGFAVPADQQYGVMVTPGTSLIPGSDNEAQVEDVH